MAPKRVFGPLEKEPYPVTRFNSALLWVAIEAALLLNQYRLHIKNKPQGAARLVSLALMIFFAVGAVVWTALAIEYARSGTAVH